MKAMEAESERNKINCKLQKEAQCELMSKNAIKTQQEAAINAIV